MARAPPALAENAKNLGIDIQVKTATWDEVTTLQNTAGIVWGWGQYSPTVLYSLFKSDLFLTGGYDNVVGYKNDVVDQKLMRLLQRTIRKMQLQHGKKFRKLQMQIIRNCT